MHCLICLHIESAAHTGTAGGIGEGEVFRHIVVAVFQFVARGASGCDVRPCTRSRRHLAPVVVFCVLRTCGPLMCQSGRNESEEYHN